MASENKQADPEMGDTPGLNEPPPAYQPNFGSNNYGATGENDNMSPSDIPPPYDQSQQPADPPPSYESVFGQMRAAKAESSGVGDFFKKFLVIVLSTVGCTICIGIVLAIPVSMIVIGAMYIHDCPKEPYIPIYLIVGGSFGVLKNLSNVIQRLRNRQTENDEENAKTNPFDGVLNCFLIVWFIAGNVWVYQIHNKFQSTNPYVSDYCHATLYYYAFWLITSTYIFLGLLCCCVCCAGVAAGATGGNKDNEQSVTTE